MPYPALAPTAFFCLKQTTRPRSWCLRLVCNPYPFPGGTAPPPIPGDPPLCTWSTPLGSASPGSPPLGCSEVPGVSPASPFRAVPVPISWGVWGVLPPHHPYGMLRGCVPTFATPWPRGGAWQGPSITPWVATGQGDMGCPEPHPPLHPHQGETLWLRIALGGAGGSDVWSQPRIYFRRGGEFQTGAAPSAVYIRAGSACAPSRRREMERLGVGFGGHMPHSPRPKNSPWLLFLPNLLAGEEEDGQTSKSPPPPCPLPSLLMLKEKKKEQPVPLGCDMRKTEFYPKCSREGRVVSLSW